MRAPACRLRKGLSRAALAVVLASGAACNTLLSIGDDEPDVPVPGPDARGSDSATTIDGDGDGADGSVPPPPPDAKADAPRAKIVFVTTKLDYGSMGGFDGGDALCNAEATSSGIQGTFVAYLHRGGGPSGHPANRLPDPGAGWSRADGVVAFVTGPRAGPPSSPIELTSDASVVAAGDRAWTGVASGPSTLCTDGTTPWTSTSGGANAAIGNPHVTTGSWEQEGVPRNCLERHHLYCFEL